MKRTLLILVGLGGLLACTVVSAWADDPWQSSAWNMDVTLPAGAYRGDGRKVEVAEGRKIIAEPGCLVENVYLFAQKGVTWNLRGSLWRSSRLEENLSCKFVAEDVFFDNVELAKCGRSVTDIWSTRWSFQNCVFAGKFTPAEVNTKHYSILAKRCTFYDLPLSTVKFRHSAAAEAQSKDFEFTNCRFVRCEVPESILATTNNCVFEDCHFSDRREDWSQAGGPIAVTAYLAGKAKAPESYHNGLLTITFKSTDAPQSGSTLTYTYENKHLAVSSIQPKGPVTSLGTGENKSVSTPGPTANSGTQAATAELVKSYRNSLVFVTGANGAGSGFLAKYATGSFLFTNAHVAAGVRGAAFKTLDGTEVKVGAASSAVGHDVFLMQATSNGLPFEIMKDVDQNAAIGDEIVVLGNAEGAGVINTITGKIVGLGPQLVEVDAPFQPGNSGSPIVHLKTGKVIGLATYAIIRKYDPSTKQPIKDPVIRRFGYRLDSIKTWQPVNWQAFFAQAVEMEAIEKLTKDLAAFLNDLAGEKGLHLGAHNNPAIKNRIDAWLEARSKKLSPRDASMADQGLISFLKVACQSDVTAARQHITYDYFQRDLADQQRERDEISGVFNEIIQNLRK